MALSDRPAEKTDLNSIRLEQSDSEHVPQLTWADILAEDPLTEEGIWDDVVIASDHSEDEYDPLSDDSAAEDHTVSTQASSVADDDIAAIARSFIVENDDRVLASLDCAHRQTAQHGLSHSETAVAIASELHVVREALFMLRCLPTRLFVVEKDSTVSPRTLLKTSSCEPSTFAPVMQVFANLGTQILRLRDWTRAPPAGSVLKRLEADVRSNLSSFDNALMKMELSFLDPDSDVVVSMLQVLGDVQGSAMLLVHLSKAISSVKSTDEPWAVLDSLFDVACDLQLVDDTDAFTDISKVFFDCLEIFLRPVHLWVTQGKLQATEESFFIHTVDDNLSRGSLWHSRYKLLRADSGRVRAPSFMHRAAHQIFISGKSTMFLDSIRADTTPMDKCPPLMKSLDADAIIATLQGSLLPFASVLETELQKWVGALQTHSMLELRQILHSQCGLQDMISVIRDVFLSLDGAHFHNFADELFHRMDRHMPWTDRFIITDLAHATLGNSKTVDTAKLSVRVMRRTSTADESVSSLEALDRITLDYSMPWPLRNIIGDLDVCRRAWALSLRIYRAEYVLMQQQKTLTDMRRVDGSNQIFTLRQRLIWFTNVYRSHVAEVHSVSLDGLRQTMAAATNVDEMVAAYKGFQTGLETRLLLAKNLRPIHQAVIDILDVVEEFARVCRRQRVFEQSERVGEVEEEGEGPVSDSPDTQSTIRDLPSLIRDFDTQLHFVMSGLNAASRSGEPSWQYLARKLQSGAENVVRG